MEDLAYFISSWFVEDDSERLESKVNRPETEIIEERLISRYEMIGGSVSVLLLVVSLITIFSGSATLLSWLGVVLFGTGSWFFVQELRAPKTQLVLSADGLIERVGNRELLSLSWAEVGLVEDNGRNENVTIRVADRSGNLLDLPAELELSGDIELDIDNFESHNHEVQFARPALNRYGSDQRKTAAAIERYRQRVGGSP